MKAKITKSLVDDKGREWQIGSDVGFIWNYQNKQYRCWGIITDINDSNFTIEDVQLDDFALSQKLMIMFNEIQGGELKLTDNSWY